MVLVHHRPHPGALLQAHGEPHGIRHRASVFSAGAVNEPGRERDVSPGAYVHIRQDELAIVASPEKNAPVQLRR